MNGPTTRALLDRLARRGQTLGIAESLTGGALTAAIVAVPGASRVLRGGVIAYAREVKAGVLGVPDHLITARGTVDPQVAVAMASGVCRVLGCDIGLATTGVAGPESADGKPVGTAFVAVVVAGRSSRVRRVFLPGDRQAVRAGVVTAALDLAALVLLPAR
ncbi:MAG: competence protein [Actinomycetales bacterium]|nr:MAG: competence protein [Actinomycetales bacterium]